MAACGRDTKRNKCLGHHHSDESVVEVVPKVRDWSLISDRAQGVALVS
ncbi:MAG: hypothetical protein HW386_898 [Gammaproteobacteria bacterium]|nr:hypothetical protein [Gammaproteobacteria bacterium]